ncbi:MAG: SpoVA/SpoVAEb family sporulation membrane protein [Bacilli bacterium]|nr:SpoVA/SpoVAEb family sporulation membrane protein [Bacilli bacterium]
MNINNYKKIVKKHTKKSNFLHNYLAAFLSGGLLGALSQIIYLSLKNIFSVSSTNAKSYISLFIIFIASFLTAIGLFDTLIIKLRSGLIIPTTGFAHSITSSAIDAKNEGLIKGIGSNFFHLAGSVILYSIIASFVLVLLRVITFG